MITHLDGRKIVLSQPAGSVTKPRQYRKVEGEGFPQHREIFNKGDLWIQFNIDWSLPTTITDPKWISVWLCEVNNLC